MDLRGEFYNFRMIMKTTILKVSILSAVLAVGLSSCLRDSVDRRPDVGGGNKVTFVVSVPSSEGGSGTRTRAGEAETTGNGHFPDGVPADYGNYSADADTETYGNAFGGYPDAEAETAAFERAVAAMRANYEKSPVKALLAEQSRAALNAPATRAIQEMEDNQVDELSVLLFDATTDQYIRKIEVGHTLEYYPGDRQRQQFTMELPEGSYKAIFVANARQETEEYIAANSTNQSLMTTTGFIQTLEIKPVTARTGVWESNPFSSNYRPFPMASKVIDLSVPNTRDFDKYPVELIRSLAKINITTSLPEEQLSIKEIWVLRHNTKGRVMPSPNWAKGADLSGRSGYNNMNDLYSPATSWMNYNSKIANNQCVDEIFLYEQMGQPDDDIYYDRATTLMIRAEGYVVGQHGTRIPFGGVNGGGWFCINFRIKDPMIVNGAYYNLATILRNYRYEVNITDATSPGYSNQADAISAMPSGLEFYMDAWNDSGEMNESAATGRYQITTDKSVLILGPESGSTATLKIYTDYRNGWLATQPEVVGTGTYLDCEFVGDQRTTEANLGEASTLTLRTTTAAPNDFSTARMLIRAGAVQKEITVIRLPAVNNTNITQSTTNSNTITDYSGAFWKHNQWGERLIKIKPNEVWSAFVLGGADWVVMDSKPSTDPGVGTPAGPEADGNDSGFDRQHVVNSTVGWAHGTAGSEGGYLRIGLKGSYAPTAEAPARYAVVLLTEGDFIDHKDGRTGNRINRFLFLRQGEWADYLFPKSERNVDGNVRFSTYNLTVPESKKADMMAMDYSDASKWSNPKEGVFTDYPTKAGAMWQGMGEFPLRGYDPLGDVDPAVWGATSTDNMFDAQTMDACPPGYHRPSGGVDMTTPSPNDEMVQSLWLNRNELGSNSIANISAGHYADGYFDRRKVESHSSIVDGTIPDCVVYGRTLEMAYLGGTVFNPNSGASIFFPFAGNKTNLGESKYVGIGGIYGSATTSPTAVNQYSHFGVLHLHGHLIPAGGTLTYSYKTAATSIRCVQGDGSFELDPVATNPPVISDDGGSHEITFSQINPDAIVSATVTTTGTGINGNTKRLMHHRAVIEYKDGTKWMVAGTATNLAGRQFRVTFPKVYYPNRDIDISATVKVTVTDGSSSYSKNVEVLQQALVYAPLTIASHRLAEQWGCLDQTPATNNVDHYICEYNQALLINNAIATKVDPPDVQGYNFGEMPPAMGVWPGENFQRKYNYVHVALNGNTTGIISNNPNANWSGYYTWQAYADGLIAIVGHYRADKVMNLADSPLMMAGYGEVRHGTTAILKKGYINTDESSKKVYRYLMDQSPWDPIATAVEITGTSSQTIGFYYDGYNHGIPVANVPWSATAMVVNGSAMTSPNATSGNTVYPANSLASTVIDVDNGLLFMGETEHFGYHPNATDYVTNAHMRFIGNLVYFVKNAAIYGSHFTDLLIEGDNGGVNPRTFTDIYGRKRVAQPAPWNTTYWGANAELAGSAN